MKIALIDLETTGLSYRKHEIVEIGCVIFDSETLKIEKEFTTKVLPEHLETADPKALEVNGYDPEGWQINAEPLGAALTALSLHTAGTHFMAQNVCFDWAFLQEASIKTGVPFAFERLKIDLPSIAFGKIPHDKMQSWSLKALCAYLGIPPEDKVHRALSGARKAYEVYKTLSP